MRLRWRRSPRRSNPFQPKVNQIHSKTKFRRAKCRRRGGNWRTEFRLSWRRDHERRREGGVFLKSQSHSHLCRNKRWHIKNSNTESSSSSSSSSSFRRSFSKKKKKISKGALNPEALAGRSLVQSRSQFFVWFSSPSVRSSGNKSRDTLIVAPEIHNHFQSQSPVPPFWGLSGLSLGKLRGGGRHKRQQGHTTKGRSSVGERSSEEILNPSTNRNVSSLLTCWSVRSARDLFRKMTERASLACLSACCCCATTVRTRGT